MKPTDNLIIEHREISELLNIMSIIADNIKSKDVFYPNDVEEIIDYLIIILDKSHQDKEDEVFYPELIMSGVPNDKAPLSIVNYEHTLAKHYLNEISSCVVNCKIGNDFSGDLLADSLTNYVIVIQNHIQREEEIVFPMANEVLSEEKQNEISQKFEDIEQKNKTHNFTDHFKNLLNKLNNKYLVKAF